MSKELKKRAAFFSFAEQELLIHLYEEYKDVIMKKGNTSCINKAREAAWHNIADRLNVSNMSGVKRTWQQVKVKYKNILQNATRKKTAAGGGGPPVAALTPAEDLALEQNSGRLIIVGIEGGTSSDPVCPHDTQPYVKVVGGVLTLLDLPVFDNDGEIAGPSRMVQEDEDTVSACSERTQCLPVL
ncbi:uncharacterized protein LOC143511587 [Brachyhypopomus gauderio]|uniref:uncharacterized protein LOC143511587 n=1 Tax=Brachyhypopomus gauderio TaxID=698409 RepID=UPI0040421E68